MLLLAVVTWGSGCRQDHASAQPNLDAAHTDCWDMPITANDSFFADFDLFSLSPRCPLKEGSHIEPHIVLNSEGNELQIHVVNDELEIGHRNIIVGESGGISVDTMLASPRTRDLHALRVYEFGPDFLARFDYSSDVFGPINWHLKMIQIVDRSLNMWTGTGIRMQPKNIGELPKIDDVATISHEQILFSENDVRVRRSCKRGNCGNSVHSLFFLLHRKQVNDGSVFWYWLFRDLLYIESPF